MIGASGSYTSGYNASYILLAQAAQNEYSKYEASEFILMEEGVYKNDLDALEKVYEDALDIEDINFDAWLGLVNLYIDEDRSDAELYALALRIIDSLTYYPRPMYDLLNLIEPNIEDNATYASFSTAFKGALTNASKATSNESLQPNACKQVANALLGNVDSTIATFSFDGDNAGKIILAERYQGVDGVSSATWEYCLTGRNDSEDGSDWNLVTTNSVKLTNKEIESITPENDILIHIVGVDYSDENIFTIDIQNASMPSDLYANDLENAVIGATDTMEWRFSEDDDWTSYAKIAPDLSGDKTVTIRIGATGAYVASDSQSFTFTTDTDTESRKYVSINHMSINSVSSEATSNAGYAKYAIDGNLNTRWHSNYSGNDYNRWIIIELDDPICLSAIEYTPTPNSSRVVANGTLHLATIYAGMNLDDVKNNSDDCIFADVEWACNQNIKTTDEFSQGSVLAKYIKIQTIDSWGQTGSTGANFTSAAMINLFEDKTMVPYEISYDELEPTNGEVKATLTLDNSFSLKDLDGLEINVGETSTTYTYTFNENGEYEFYLMYDGIEEGVLTAKVDWIDNVAPVIDVNAHSKTHQITADINIYDPDENSFSSGIKESTVSLKVQNDIDRYSDDLNVNENDYDLLNGYENVMPNDDGTYIFNDLLDDTNYLIVIDAEDNVGNISHVICPISTPNVTDLTNDEVDFTFSTDEITNGDVTVTIFITDETITLELDSNDFCLVYSVDGGNTWTDYTENGIIVTEENVTVLIALMDKNGNVGSSASITVDNIDKTAPDVEINYTKVDGNHESDLCVTIYSSEKIKYTQDLKNAGWEISDDGMSLTKIYDDTLDEDEEVIIQDLAGNTTTAIVKSNAVNGVVDHDKYYVELEYYDASGKALSSKEYTNEDVIVVLASGDEKIVINNNNGSSNFTFTENGTFIFNFTYSNGILGSIKAEVTWIDKTLPEASITVVERTIDSLILDLYVHDEDSGFNSGSFIVEDEDGNVLDNCVTYTDSHYVLSNLDPTKDYVIYFTVEDNAGNVRTLLLNVPHLTEDILDINVLYNLTQDGVLVTVTSSVPLNELDGWELSSDGLALSKLFAEELDENEVYKVTDENGALYQFEVSSVTVNSLLEKLLNIEFSNLEIDISFKITDDGVLVTILSNVELEEIDGWDLSEDKYSISKIFTDKIDENIILNVMNVNGEEILIEISKNTLNALIDTFNEIESNLEKDIDVEDLTKESDNESSENQQSGDDVSSDDSQDQNDDTSSKGSSSQQGNSSSTSSNNRKSDVSSASQNNDENSNSNDESVTLNDEKSSEISTIPYTGNSNASVYILAIFIFIGIGLSATCIVFKTKD